MFIEIKCGPEIVEPLAQKLAIATVPLEQLIVISFKAEVIAACEARMPELKSSWGYPLTLGAMAASAAGQLYFFYRKGWFG